MIAMSLPLGMDRLDRCLNSLGTLGMAGGAHGFALSQAAIVTYLEAQAPDNVAQAKALRTLQLAFSAQAHDNTADDLVQEDIASRMRTLHG
jgi:hypothetical protein